MLLNHVEQMPLQVFSEDAYLSYSMYVIMDRALPFIGDGLKPVQRRIVYAMSELGLKATAKYKKSARTVGDVLGKYHPHGDTACYEAMVLMAQPFSYRYPLIDGQGNWGAVDDPKSFAAMRYTEARLSAYAQVLLSELGQGTVDWGPNFDGTLKEPLCLPARLPNLLLNGATGIAVGMATDVPPHNLTEVVNACVELLTNPKAGVAELCRHIKGPDYPTRAEIITPQDQIQEIYRTGHGMIRMRAAWNEENGDIVITALPHQVSPAKIMEQLAAQMTSQKLALIGDIRDESDQDEPVRIVITPRSNRVDKKKLMSHLFVKTDLEKTCRVNMNVIGLDRRPQVKGLVQVLSEWLTFRFAVVKKRLTHRLSQVLDRLHVVDGLLIALADIDRVIAIIRRSDEPKPELIKAFNLSERQAEAILQLRLRHLARLEEIKLKDEKKVLDKERAELEGLLKSDRRIKTLIKKELLADAQQYGDERKCAIVERQQAIAIDATELVPAEPVTVVLSRQGWVRTGKGHEVDPLGLNYKSADTFLAAARGRSNQPAIFMDSAGRSYAANAGDFPSARSYGNPLTGIFKMGPEAQFTTVLMGAPDQKVLVASSAGYGFVSELSQMVTRNQKGKAFLSLPKYAQPLAPRYIDQSVDQLSVVLVTLAGRLLVISLSELPELPKGKGNKLINIHPRDLKTGLDSLKIMELAPAGAGFTIVAGKRTFTLTPGNVGDFSGPRAKRGRFLPRGFRNVEQVVVATE